MGFFLSTNFAHNRHIRVSDLPLSPAQGMGNDGCRGRHIQRLYRTRPGQGQHYITLVQCIAGKSMLLIAQQHQARLPIRLQRLQRLPLDTECCPDNTAVTLDLPQQGRQICSSKDCQTIQPTFGNSVRRIRQACLLRVIRQHQMLEAKKNEAACNGTDVVRITDAIQNKQGCICIHQPLALGSRQPMLGLRCSDGNYTAMQNRPGNLRQLVPIDFAIRPA